MINLDKFDKEIEVIVPIANGFFCYRNKQYRLDQNVNGWYKVKIKGNDAELIELLMPDLMEQNGFTIIKGYVFNNNIIFQNFDVGFRKTGYEVMAELYFNEVDNFTSIEAIYWDRKLFYYRPNYSDFFISEVKQVLDNGEDIKQIKGITQELKTICLFHELEQKKIKELKKQEEENVLKQTLEGQLYLSFKRVGAEIINYSITGNRIIVDWSINSQDFNSILDRNTFQVIEAGYCMSGHDKEHSLHSMVVLAKQYDKEDLIYKTRN